MGLLSSEQVPLMGSPAHSLAEHLLTMLSYKAGERDMVILHDIIDIEWPNNTKVRIIHNRAGKNGPAAPVLAGPVFLKLKMKCNFYKKELINKSASVIFVLVRLIILSYNR